MNWYVMYLMFTQFSHDNLLFTQEGPDVNIKVSIVKDFVFIFYVSVRTSQGFCYTDITIIVQQQLLIFLTNIKIKFYSSDPYIVEQSGYSTAGCRLRKLFFQNNIFVISANDIIASTVKEIGKQFRAAFMVEETKRDIYTKVSKKIFSISSENIYTPRWRGLRAGWRRMARGWSRWRSTSSTWWSSGTPSTTNKRTH